MPPLDAAIESVRRKHADRLTPGDFVCASFETANLQVAAALTGIELALDESAALLPALSAGMTLVNDSAEQWVARKLLIKELRIPKSARATRARAQVKSVRAEQITIGLEGKHENERIYRGDLVIARRVLPSGAAVDGGSGAFFTVQQCPASISLGASGAIILDVRAACTLELTMPYGHGLRSRGGLHFEVQPGTLKLNLIADRPHEVNLGKPWLLTISAHNQSETQKTEIAIRVPDPQPGTTYYILTEDCETFDGGPLTGAYGGAETLGNHNNFMDPEEYLIQMVAKPARMNEIAEKHGACWTHFWAAHQRFGAEWASRQSRTGLWETVLAELDASVRAGSLRHEYAPHLHCDYEPDSALPPQPRLIYDSSTDGLLPNEYYDPALNPTHRNHDWDGGARGGPGIKSLGQWDDIDSKTGSLFRALHHLSALQAQNRGTICGRTGSYDFGATPQDQETSTLAYETLGLRANSDACADPAEVIDGGHLSWRRRDDRSRKIDSLRDAALVQLAVTRDAGFDVLEDVNDWFAKHVQSCAGPGVHGLALSAHAMFMRGTPDPFRSLEGACFDHMDQHLAWVRAHYPGVRFATASEAVIEFLDYYTPKLLGIVDPRLVGGDPEARIYTFGVHLLGKGIVVDQDSPATIELVAPACFRPTDIESMEARLGEETVAHTTSHRVSFSITTRALPITLSIQVVEQARPRVADMFMSGTATPFHDPPERPRPDLLHLKGADNHPCLREAVKFLTQRLAGSDPLFNNSASLELTLFIGAALHNAGKLEGGDVPSAIDVVFPEETLADTLFSAVRVSYENDGASSSGVRWARKLLKTAKSMGQSRD